MFKREWLVKCLIVVGAFAALLSFVSIETDLQNSGTLTVKLAFKNNNAHIESSSATDILGIDRNLIVADPTSQPTSAVYQSQDHFYLFGGFHFLAGEKAAVSFVCIVMVILMFEHFFHEIHSLTHETPFAEMVSAMEKELMIVGCTSFAFKVLLVLSGFMDTDTIHTVDVLDTVTVISAFIFCFGGLVLIQMSIRETDVWAQSFHLHVLEILCEYYAVTEDSLHDTGEDEEEWFGIPLAAIEKYFEHHLQKFRWLPLSRINAEVEFRIIHTAFCDTFNLQKDAFAFDDYCSRCFEKHILNLVTIDPMNWILLLVLCCLNWGRVYLGWWGPEKWCTRHAYDAMQATAGNPELHEDAVFICKQEVEILCFFGLGCLLVVLNLFLAAISRYYEFKVLAREGVHSVEDYPEFLIAASMVSVAVKVEKTRLSADDLKAAIIAGEEHAEAIAQQRNPVWELVHSFLGCFYKRTNVMDRQDATRVSKSGQWASIVMRQLRAGSSHKLGSDDAAEQQARGDKRVSGKGVSGRSNKGSSSKDGSPRRRRRKRQFKKDNGSEEEQLKAVISRKQNFVSSFQSEVSELGEGGVGGDNYVPHHGARGDSNMSMMSDASELPNSVPHGARIDSGMSGVSGVSGFSAGSSAQHSRDSSDHPPGIGGTGSGTLTPPRRGMGKYTITEGNEFSSGLIPAESNSGGRVAANGNPNVMNVRDRQHLSPLMNLQQQNTHSNQQPHLMNAGRVRSMSEQSNDSSKDTDAAGPLGGYSSNEANGVSAGNRERIMSSGDYSSYYSDSEYNARSRNQSEYDNNSSSHRQQQSLYPTSIPLDKARIHSDSTASSGGNKSNNTGSSGDAGAICSGSGSGMPDPLSVSGKYRPHPKGPISAAAYGTLVKGDMIADSDQLPAAASSAGSSPGGVNSPTDRGQFSLKKAATMRDMENEYNQSIKKNVAKSLKSADGREMTGIFWADRSDLYFDWVDHMMMLISFYLALWIVNYIAIALMVHHSVMWLILTVTPGIASFAIFLATVRSSTLLKAACRLDQELVHRTMEDAELGEQLGKTVREKILQRLPNDEGVDPKTHLQALFDYIDTDGSMVLSRLELKAFLKELHISFSNKRWKQIFREIDRNLDDEISFDELFLFIYPDAEEAIKKEKKRIALVKRTIDFYNSVPAIAKLQSANNNSSGVANNGSGGAGDNGDVTAENMNHAPTLKVNMVRRTNIALPSAVNLQEKRRHALDASIMDISSLHRGEDHRITPMSPNVHGSGRGRAGTMESVESEDSNRFPRQGVGGGGGGAFVPSLSSLKYNSNKLIGGVDSNGGNSNEQTVLRDSRSESPDGQQQLQQLNPVCSNVAENALATEREHGKAQQELQYEGPLYAMRQDGSVGPMAGVKMKVRASAKVRAMAPGTDSNSGENGNVTPPPIIEHMERDNDTSVVTSSQVTAAGGTGNISNGSNGTSVSDSIAAAVSASVSAAVTAGVAASLRSLSPTTGMISKTSGKSAKLKFIPQMETVMSGTEPEECLSGRQKKVIAYEIEDQLQQHQQHQQQQLQHTVQTHGGDSGIEGGIQDLLVSTETESGVATNSDEVIAFESPVEPTPTAGAGASAVASGGGRARTSAAANSPDAANIVDEKSMALKATNDETTEVVESASRTSDTATITHRHKSPNKQRSRNIDRNNPSPNRRKRNTNNNNSENSSSINNNGRNTSRSRPKKLGPRVEDLFGAPLLTSHPGRAYQQAAPNSAHWNHRQDDGSYYNYPNEDTAGLNGGGSMYSSYVGGGGGDRGDGSSYGFDASQSLYTDDGEGFDNDQQQQQQQQQKNGADNSIQFVDGHPNYYNKMNSDLNYNHQASLTEGLGESSTDDSQGAGGGPRVSGAYNRGGYGRNGSLVAGTGSDTATAIAYNQYQHRGQYSRYPQQQYHQSAPREYQYQQQQYLNQSYMQPRPQQQYQQSPPQPQQQPQQEQEQEQSYPFQHAFIHRPESPVLIHHTNSSTAPNVTAAGGGSTGGSSGSIQYHRPTSNSTGGSGGGGRFGSSGVTRSAPNAAVVTGLTAPAGDHRVFGNNNRIHPFS